MVVRRQESWQTGSVSDRRQRLQRTVLYLVCDARPDDFLARALRGGVEIVQLRIKDGSDEQVLAAGRRFRAATLAGGALLILNDRPDLATAVDADGVHVGQDDIDPARARALVGPERLLGLSTHSPGQIAAAQRAGVDYIGVGPVYATPTKPGRTPVGLELVRHAAQSSAAPFFAIGGITVDNVAAVRGAGARRVAVVRALTHAADPRAAASALRAALSAAPEKTGARVGAA